jgi:DNA modification methylase
MIIKDNKKILEFNKTEIENKIICGETLQVLKKIPSKSIQTIITSPSYFLNKEYCFYLLFVYQLLLVLLLGKQIKTIFSRNARK